MSLGLGDLKKKRASTAKSTPHKKGQTRPKYPSGAWAGSITARPWSVTDLSRPATSRGRKSSVDTDAVMNEEWLSEHAAPLFWIDLESESKLARLQEHLVKLESRIDEKVIAPLKTLKNFLVRSRH